MKILSSLNYSPPVPNLFYCLSSVKKKDILKNVGMLTVAIHFHSISFLTMEVNGYRQLWLPTFFKISFFCAQQKKRNSVEFGKTECVNDDRALFVLMSASHHKYVKVVGGLLM